MRDTRSWILLIAAIGLAACGREERVLPGDPAGPETFAVRDLPLPCRAEGYPCTWNEVPDSIIERTKHLGQIAALLTVRTPSLDTVAAFLAGRSGVADVVIDGTGVRYRLEGGRYAWVFLPGEMEHHRGTPPTRVSHAAPAARTGHHGAVPLLTAAVADLGRRIGPAPLYAQAQEDDEREVAGEPGDGKKALVLSPYEFEFPGVGARFTSRARLVRDYRTQHDGSVQFHADLDPFSDNPARPGSEYRTIGGEATLSGEVVFEDFLGWDEYNLIVLASHGGSSRCDRRIPGGGRVAGRVRPGPDLRAGDPESPRECPLIYAGRAKQQTYGNYYGVDIYFAVHSVQQEERPAERQTRYDTPGREGWRGERNQNRGLTREEANACEALVLANAPDPTTPDGRPCLMQRWEHDHPMLVLWWPFFTTQYSDGLNNAIVFLAACHSAKGGILLNALAPEGNEAITVFGFSTTTFAPRAWALIDEMLELLDKGYDSGELVRRLREYDREIGQRPEYQQQPDCDGNSCTTPTNPDEVLRGRTLDPFDDHLPATPAELRNEVAARTHGRDIVLLVDPRTGRELQDGGSIRVIGSPGDDREDRLDVHPQILGVIDETDLRDVRMEVRVVGEAVPETYYRPDREIEEAAYRFEGEVRLGRDHEDGELVDLEVRVELPGGTYSRWIYDDIRLGGLCYWTATLTGGIEREVSGASVSIGHLDAGSAGVFGSVSLAQAPGVDAGEGIWFQFLEEPVERDYTIDSRRGDAGAMLSMPEVPWGPIRRGRVRLTEVSDTLAVGGFIIEYDGLTLPQFDSERFTMQGEFVWTPSCPTWMDHMQALGERTADFIEERIR